MLIEYFTALILLPHTHIYPVILTQKSYEKMLHSSKHLMRRCYAYMDCKFSVIEKSSIMIHI